MNSPAILALFGHPVVDAIEIVASDEWDPQNTQIEWCNGSSQVWLESKNTGGQMPRRHHRVGRGAAEFEPAETATAVDSMVESAHRVVEPRRLGVTPRRTHLVTL